jgi:hypothetical protein
MAPRTWLTTLALITIVGAPAGAQEQKQRVRENPGATRQAERTPAQSRERAVPRSADSQRDVRERHDEQGAHEAQTQRDQQAQRSFAARQNSEPDLRRNEDRGRTDAYRNSPHGRYDSGRYGYAVPRRYTPRIIHPTVVRVIPYRPYVYRPSYSLGVYYGSNGYYPYGYTPRGYFEPLPGRLYGGVRITGAPRDARVFADGYYVGIVNDFDGVFQHMNLEAGPHHIEIDLGSNGLGFDVYVRPGETTTFRADRY